MSPGVSHMSGFSPWHHHKDKQLLKNTPTCSQPWQRKTNNNLSHECINTMHECTLELWAALLTLFCLGAESCSEGRNHLINPPRVEPTVKSLAKLANASRRFRWVTKSCSRRGLVKSVGELTSEDSCFLDFGFVGYIKKGPTTSDVHPSGRKWELRSVVWGCFEFSPRFRRLTRQQQSRYWRKLNKRWSFSFFTQICIEWSRKAFPLLRCIIDA